MGNHAESMSPVHSGTAAIETNNLSKRFKGRIAVDHLSIRIPRGAIAGFIGPNGAGKTTTIRMLLGLICPSSGNASVLGHAISNPRSYLPRVGALIESPAMYPGLSGRRNLEVLARLGGFPLSQVDKALETVDLLGRADDLARTYSLGMKQRLGMAMALIPDPDLLILDEPTNGLDPLGIIEMRDTLRSLRDTGKTILISSHLLQELEQVIDWLVILRDGKALFNASVHDLVQEDTSLEQNFLSMLKGDGSHV